ncbi:MAG: hypothetical protein M1505_00640 [Patescibacteria group bacterium]|nr:hypothetical protein [Patescibacteria group bacterium]
MVVVTIIIGSAITEVIPPSEPVALYWSTKLILALAITGLSSLCLIPVSPKSKIKPIFVNVLKIIILTMSIAGVIFSVTDWGKLFLFSSVVAFSGLVLLEPEKFFPDFDDREKGGRDNDGTNRG